jgi:hypothetical protein
MFKMTIQPDQDGVEPFEIDAKLRDLVWWEKAFKGRSLGMLSNEGKVSATIMFEIGYSACRRQGVLDATVTLEQFINTHDIELEDDETDEDEDGTGDEDPTRAGAFTEPSSLSPSIPESR